MIELHAKLNKIYNGSLALEVDTNFKASRIHVILGPNGSGKTTLLRLLAGVIGTDRDGKIICKTTEDSDCPFPETILVPDRSGLFNTKVFQNCLYGLKIRNIRGKDAKVRVEKSLDAVNLLHKKHENALELSNGEAQRLCLAMAIAINPQVILLDEPTASLDPENAAVVEKIILNMKSENRIIILVTHNIFQAKRLSDQVSFLFNGQIQESAAAETFFETPETPEAQRFLSGTLVY